MGQLTSGGQMIEVIHFVYPTSDAVPLDWRIACMPSMVEFHQTPHHPVYRRTDSPRAVTCPQCKRTAAYRAEYDRQPK